MVLFERTASCLSHWSQRYSEAIAEFAEADWQTLLEAGVAVGSSRAS